MFGGGTPLTMDPALNSASVSGNYIRCAQAGLMGHYYDADGNIVLGPELAESTDLSADGLVYTFTLRKGLKWSDGTDFLAPVVSS
jgi:oligopeptide transport system substrate-binding protein